MSLLAELVLEAANAVDKANAKAILLILSNSTSPFKELVYMSKSDRAKVKFETGVSLSKIVPQPTKGVKLTKIIAAATGNDDWYIHDGDLVKSSRTVVPGASGKTFKEVIKQIGFKSKVFTQKG